MFPGWLQDFFQDDHFKWKIQRNSMIPNYSMIPAIRLYPAIRWSPAIGWSPVIRWLIGSMDFDNPKVYGHTSINDGLVFLSAPVETTRIINNITPQRLKQPSPTHSMSTGRVSSLWKSKGFDYWQSAEYNQKHNLHIQNVSGGPHHWRKRVAKLITSRGILFFHKKSSQVKKWAISSITTK